MDEETGFVAEPASGGGIWVNLGTPHPGQTACSLARPTVLSLRGLASGVWR